MDEEIRIRSRRERKTESVEELRREILSKVEAKRKL